MARITVEDCLQYVENRFELVRLAAVRARQLDQGYTPKLEHTGEKNTLFALREIAAGKVDRNILKIQEEATEEGDTVDFQEGMRRMAEDEKKRREEEEKLTNAALKTFQAKNESDKSSAKKDEDNTETVTTSESSDKAED